MQGSKNSTTAGLVSPRRRASSFAKRSLPIWEIGPGGMGSSALDAAIGHGYGPRPGRKDVFRSAPTACVAALEI
jgi:hypothetical protein